MTRTLVLLALLAGCGGGGGGGGDGNWGMDPRLKEMANWAYDCMVEVTGLKPGARSTPKVKGVNEPWGSKGAFGTYYWPSRRIKVQITRPYDHLVDIMLHEMGHDAGHRLNTDSEDYANWVNNECRKKVRPGIYPAPPIDWDAVTPLPLPVPPSGSKPGQGKDHE